MVRRISAVSYRALFALVAVVAVLGGIAAQGAAQVGLTSTPTVTMSPEAPLAGVLNFSTDLPASVSLSVRGGGEAWMVSSNGLTTQHAIPLLGLTPNSQYTVDHLTLTTAGGAATTVGNSLNVATAPLPANFPLLDLKTSMPQQMEPGLVLIPSRNQNRSAEYTFALDPQGQVRWYTPADYGDIRQLPNGNLLSRGRNPTTIREFDVQGSVVRSWHSSADTVPNSVPVAMTNPHHDVFPMANGNFLTLDRRIQSVDNFPSSETDPNAPRITADVNYDPIVEFTPQGNVVGEWSLLDILDPTRIGYGTIGGRIPNDWSHSNAVVHDPSDDSIIVSVRHQDAVIKFSRATGDLKWILGPHDKWGPAFQQFLLTPKGQPFEWPYHTHSPMVLPNGNVMVYDNGNFRATPFDPPLAAEDSHTRAVEFEIDESTMEITQVWEYGSNTGEVFFTPTQGDADGLPTTDNVQITFSRVTHIDGVALANSVSRIIEVDRLGTRLFDLEISYPTLGAISYRSERISTLYPQGFAVTAVPLPAAAWMGLALLGGAGLLRAWRGRSRIG